MAVANQGRPDHVIPLVRLTLNGGTQPRAELDQDAISDYAAAMAEGAEFPPVVVYHDGSHYWLADGFHRVRAAEQLGQVSIRATVRQGTRRDAVLHSVGANTDHGLRRTNADKRRAIETLLHDEEWARWSDNKIARACGVSVSTVGIARASLFESNSDKKLTQRAYQTKHGTEAVMDTAAIGRRSGEPLSATRLGSAVEPPLSPAAAPHSYPTASPAMSVHFSSETAEHYTPAHVVMAAAKVLDGIDLDPCSNSKTAPNVPAARVFTAEDDGLTQTWSGTVYMNPPYGGEIKAWVEKLADSYENGQVSAAIALVPSRTDTAWFRRFTNYPVCFISGRLTFIGNDAPAPFPSAIFYLGRHVEEFYEAFEKLGTVYCRWAPGMALNMFCPHGVDLGDRCEQCDARESSRGPGRSSKRRAA